MAPLREVRRHPPWSAAHVAAYWDSPRKTDPLPSHAIRPYPPPARPGVREGRAREAGQGGGSAGGPGQGAAAEDVGVHVEDGLAGALAGVEDDPVAGVRDAFGLGDLAGEVGDLVEQAVTGFGHGGQVLMVLFGDNEYMRGCLRVNIPEREGAWTIENPRRRYLPGHNLAEKTVRHRRNLNVRLIPGYCLPSVAPAAPAPPASSRRRCICAVDLSCTCAWHTGRGGRSRRTLQGWAVECRGLGYAPSAAPGRRNLWRPVRKLWPQVNQTR